MYGYGSSSSGDIWGILIGVLIGAVVLFFILREVFCWYWKINRIVELLEQQNSLLSSMLRNFNSTSSSGANPPPVSPPPSVNYGNEWTCKKCNQSNPVTSSTCKSCGEYK